MGKKSLHYKELSSEASDAFDDFEIEYDEISEASETDVKLYFQRLQQGLPLTSSEKLNAVHSSLRNYCRELAKQNFCTSKVNFANKRYAHFDVAAKVATIEVEGFETGLRFDDIKEVFSGQSTFSAKSVVGQRLRRTFAYLDVAFPEKAPELRNRTFVQSAASLAAAIVRTGNSEGTEVQFRRFIGAFNRELSRQVELGLDATDEDYILFQKSINANVRGAAKTRHTILLRKLLQFDPKFLDVFGHSIIASSGLIQETKRLGDSIGSLIEKVNIQYAASHGVDLVKPTNKTLAAIRTFSNPIRDFAAYTDFINALYFVFWEGTGERLKGKVPPSFVDINTLRTDLQHDLDHGKPKKAASKRKKSSATFRKYANSSTPQTSAPDNFPLLQVGLLNQIEGDLRTLVLTLV